MSKRKLQIATSKFDFGKQRKINKIPGYLGFMINGNQTVEVPSRPGFVFVRLRGSTSEVIQAYNDQVAPVYGLPVLVYRDEVDQGRYKIAGRDTGVYNNWGSASSYLPIHGHSHSFIPEEGGGGDIAWIYSRQMMPLAVYPSGSFGAGMVIIKPATYYQNNVWHYAGGTGTSSLLSYKPTGSSARMVLVSVDVDGNPKLTAGSSYFADTITGSSAIIPYLPSPLSTDIPIAGIRLVSGTSVILWDNIYDVRPWIVGDGFISQTIDQGILVYDDAVFKGTGTAFVFQDNLTVVNTGTTMFISATAGGEGGGSGLVIYDDSVYKVTGTAISFDTNLTVGVTGSTVYVSSTASTGSSSTSGYGATVLLNQTLSSPSASFYVSGSSIATYDELRITIKGAGDQTGTASYSDVDMWLNGDLTAGNYHYKSYRSGNVTTSFNSATIGVVGGNNLPGMVDVLILNPGDNQYKIAQSQTVASYGLTANTEELWTFFYMWENSGTISQIKLSPTVGNFLAGTKCMILGYKSS